MGLLGIPFRLTIAVLAMVSGLALPASGQTDLRLLQKTSLDYDKATIGDVLKDLAERHKLTLAVSPEVENRRIDRAVVHFHADGLTLGSALNRLESVSRLVCSIGDGELRVISRNEEGQRFYPVSYPAAGWETLVQDAEHFAQGLMHITGGRWKAINRTGGSIGELTPEGLVIEQTSLVHRKLRQLFATLSIQSSGRKPTPTAVDRAELRILAAFQRPLTLNAEELPLREFCQQTLTAQKIGYQVDLTSGEGIGWDGISVRIPGDATPVGEILANSLNSHGVVYWIADEVLVMSTPAQAEQTQTIQIYNVERQLKQGETMTNLMALLQSDPDLGGWEMVDGEGGAMLPLGSLLIVRQAAGHQGKIAAHLR